MTNTSNGNDGPKTVVETPWMTEKEAAVYLRRSPDTLSGWRFAGIGPPWHQPVPRGAVSYHRDELDQWMRGQASPAV